MKILIATCKKYQRSCVLTVKALRSSGCALPVIIIGDVLSELRRELTALEGITLLETIEDLGWVASIKAALDSTFLENEVDVIITMDDLVMTKQFDGRAFDFVEQLFRAKEYDSLSLYQPPNVRFSIAARSYFGLTYNVSADAYPISCMCSMIKIETFRNLLQLSSDAWDFEQIKTYIIEKRAQQFDPTLVDIAIEHWQEVIDIRQSYPD